MTWQELGIKKYQDYFHTLHWYKLKEKELLKNISAVCWVCGLKVFAHIYRNQIKSTLVIHHVSYKNLGSEKIYRDYFIICHNDHTKAHYWFNGAYKIPLKYPDLRRRLYYLKSIDCFRKRRYMASLWYFFIFTLL